MEEGIGPKIDEANKRTVEAMLQAQPVWIDLKPAIEAVPGMRKNILLHSGPPVKWVDMCGAHRNGVIDAITHEDLATERQEAIELLESGEVKLASALDYRVVGPGWGITSASMPVHVVKDETSGKEGFCYPFRSLVIKGDSLESNLRWQESTLAPILSDVLRESGGLNIKSMIAKGTQMGDESHTRQVAECALAIAEVMPRLVKADLDKSKLVECVDYFTKTERFFHSISMAGAVATLEAAAGIDYSTIVTFQGGNGVEFGIKCSSLGDRWFTGRAPAFKGIYLSPRWGPEDALPYCGDSCVVESVGLGAFAAAAAPSVLRMRGGSVKDAIHQTMEMRQICVGTNSSYPIPLLEFEGPPIGVDIRKVLETGIAPLSHGGISSREGGQIGVGVARLPMECFEKAVYAFAEKCGL